MLKYCFYSIFFLSSLFIFLCCGKGVITVCRDRTIKKLYNPELRGLKSRLKRIGAVNLKLENLINAFIAYRHLTQNQFQKFNVGPFYIYLWKLQNTEY